jgi:hypothetical protein
MKTFSLIILAIGCAAVLFYGNQYWEERTSPSAHENQSANEGGTDTEATETADYETLIENWPEEAKASFRKALKEGTPYRLALVGSSALGEDENGWAEQVKDRLESTFDGKLEVEIYAYDTTSIDFVNGEDAEEVLNSDPDLVLLEPFALSDNSNLVGSENNHESIQIFKRKLNEQNEEAVLMLQPTHPIVGATYYPKQIEELQAFAEEQNIPYLNHWTAWPEEDALSAYLVESQETPNEEGHEVWAKYLLEYFIAEEE